MGIGPNDSTAEEQAALRRLATLVAAGAPPDEIFTAVAEESGRLLCCDFTTLSQYDRDESVVVGAWSRSGAGTPVPVGSRFPLDGHDVSTLVFESKSPARLNDYVQASSGTSDVVRRAGVRGVVGVPITVEGRLWGVLLVATVTQEPLPADTETRLAGFAELLATAVASALAKLELRRFAEEQAALRRVATLVARSVEPDAVFAAVAEEAGNVFAVGYTVVSRYDADGTALVVGGWAAADPGRPLLLGLRLKPEGRNMHAIVYRTRQPARIDNYSDASGAFAETARDWGFRSAVGVPINVEDRLWGVMIV